MNFDPSLPDDSRRNFVKKSLAASIIAAQPTILAGLIRAQGGGGGTGTTEAWGTTWGTTEAWGTTDPWATTDPFDTTDLVETEPVELTDFWDVLGDALGPDGADEGAEPDSITLTSQNPVGNPPYTGEGEEPPREYGEAAPVSVGPQYVFKAKFWALEKSHDAKVKLQVAGEIYRLADGANVATTARNGIVGEIVNQSNGELGASPDPAELGSARVGPPDFEEIDGAKYVWRHKVFLGAPLTPGGQADDGPPLFTQPDIHNAYLKGCVYCVTECTKSNWDEATEMWVVDADFDAFDQIKEIPFTLHLKSHNHPDEE